MEQSLLERGSVKKGLIFGRFSHKPLCYLSILLVQNISVLDKLRKFFSCLWVDYEKKKQILLNPLPQFLYRLIERKGMHYAEAYMCLEEYFVFICQLPPKTCRQYIQNPLSLRKLLYMSLHFDKVLVSLTQSNTMK